MNMQMAKSEEATLNGSAILDNYHLVEEGPVSSDSADPRITSSNRATSQELDTQYTHQLSNYIHHKSADGTEKKRESLATEVEVPHTKEDSPIYVCFKMHHIK
jgi:hypothetical protein